MINLEYEKMQKLYKTECFMLGDLEEALDEAGTKAGRAFDAREEHEIDLSRIKGL